MLTRLLAVGALVLVTAAYSQQPPRQHKPIANNQASKEQTNLGATEKSPVVVKVLPPSEAEQKTAAEREDRKEKLDKDMSRFTEDLATYTRYLAWFTGALIVIGCVQAMVFWIQAIRLKEAIESGERIERPFVVEGYNALELMPPGFVMHVYPESDVTYVPKVQFMQTNCGKTPAIIISEYADLVVLESLPAAPPFMEMKEFGESILGAGDHVPPVVVQMGDGSPQYFSSADWNDMRDGKKFFLFLGRIKYKSILDQEHDTRWAYRWYIKDGRSYFAAVGGNTYNQRT